MKLECKIPENLQMSDDNSGLLNGIYVYCICPTGEGLNIGQTGIDGKNIYTLAYKDICALVNDCLAQPYQSYDARIVSDWIMTHHQVVETAWRQFGTCIPMAFNVIVAPGNNSAEENLTEWLNSKYDSLSGELKYFENKSEYGVQIFWEPSLVAKKAAEENLEIKELNEAIKSKPRGLSYLYRKRLEKVLKDSIEKMGETLFREFYNALKLYVDKIKIEKVKGESRQEKMLMNLSCLVSDRFADFKAELDKIGSRDGISVRLIGPMPPYSFC